MSKPLFEFVKVAAGEPFPYPDGKYLCSVSPDEGFRKFPWKTGTVIKHNDWYLYVPAEFPDAGREGLQILIDKWKDKVSRLASTLNYPDAESEIDLSARDLLNCLESFVSDLSSLPATNVGDISAGDRKSDTYWYETGFKDGKAAAPVPDREEFIEKMCRSFIPPLYKADVPKLADFMRSHWPTPADPGSQVEAGEFAEWVYNQQWTMVATGIWAKIENGWERQATTADLIALYQQSLNEKK